MRKIRNKIEIIEDILKKSTNKNLNKTKLMLKTNLNTKTFNKYITMLEENDLLNCHHHKFFTTPKGHELLELINKIKRMVGDVSHE